MAEIQNYQCPACGAPLEYAAGTSKLHCPYCESDFEIDELKSKEKESSVEENQDGENLVEISCTACGAKIVCQPTTAATSCPYCNNTAVVTTQFKGELKPDYIIPFAIKKERAVSLLKEFYKGKPLLPKTFTSENSLQEVKGVYVPFYFFDGTADGYAIFKSEKHITHQNSRETVKVTRHYDCIREGSMDFKMVPVDASKQMDNDLMDSLEPFDYDGLKPFSTGFLPGYLADIRDEDGEDLAKRAANRTTESLRQAFYSTVVGYDSVSLSAGNATFSSTGQHYGLLPVYLLNTKWQDKMFSFAINGQTGKTIGTLPISAAKSVARFFKGFFISAAIEALIVFLGIKFGDWSFDSDEAMMMLAGCSFLSLIIAITSLSIARAAMKTVSSAKDATCYVSDRLKLRKKNDMFITETKVVIPKDKK